MTPAVLNLADARYPKRLSEHFGTDAPPQLSALSNLDLLALPKTALLCSARCPGDAILRTYDQAAKWRDAGRCVISGFHLPRAETRKICAFAPWRRCLKSNQRSSASISG
ncbi:MAG: hypothetical protein HY298_06430 [Verrucomicrobia bacterium]|nr:hypothetical protein [Verrucomicrobiota bacterium]